MGYDGYALGGVVLGLGKQGLHTNAEADISGACRGWCVLACCSGSIFAFGLGGCWVQEKLWNV